MFNSVKEERPCRVKKSLARLYILKRHSASNNNLFAYTQAGKKPTQVPYLQT